MKTTVLVNGVSTTHYKVIATLATETGYVMGATCTYKIGNIGFCSHAGGLLYAVAKITSACTSNLCQWSVPRNISNTPSPKRLKDIIIIKSEKNPPQYIKPYADVHQADACKNPDVFMNDFEWIGHGQSVYSIKLYLLIVVAYLIS